MSNVDSTSTPENPRSLKNLFLDLKEELKSRSEVNFKSRKKLEECAASSSDASCNSNSNFDEELSSFLKNTNQNGNLLDLFNKKYFIGYAISEAFSGTDLDAYTLFHIWNTKRSSQKSCAFYNHSLVSPEEGLELTNRPEHFSKDQFVVFYQQLFFSYQSELELIDRTRPIFKIPPQDNSLVHAIEPKTTTLILLTYLYGLNNVKFIGLRNFPDHSTVPGPYLSLLNIDSKSDFITCLTKFNELIFKNAMNSDNSYYFNFEGYLNLSYFVYELDFIYSYILVEENCYSKYTEPILLKSFTNRVFGKASLALNLYRMRSRYKDLSISEVLSRFDSVLSLICKIFFEFKSAPKQAPLDKNNPKVFNFLCFTCIVYSYIYSILSIPLQLLPWEVFVPDKFNSKTEKPDKRRTAGTENGTEETDDKSQDSTLPNGVDYSSNDDTGELKENFTIVDMSVHNEFAETAADSTCIENTRRHDNLMTYIIGLVNGEGNWIKKKEKFVDLIDTYKLGLSWYRRPSFSNTLYNNNSKAWPISIFYYNLLIEPCGRAFFVWYWKNIEAWGSSNIWSSQPKFSNQKTSIFGRFLNKLSRKPQFQTDSNLGLKRLVSLRLRDTVSYVFDIELELKKALLY
ncbi:hypothetical protein TpMuguga_04g00205 [Theileria parva strain Muguga]|uniref:Uncharacterized protein n=1 Tax=Theileria parva TaxID=5875 RepID=Q4N2Y7_THEPA|nr:uncharacterized protein TpMuguga_04g00205 [Theileria parva strain Muguga]EAN31557.1 hypothetical protein TpMuguga_04g00205 [Theileria parva strain Muguga]|eukprot:XP_763840.1 hypothetical protein [Theileria parva strain Muguga]